MTRIRLDRRRFLQTGLTGAAMLVLPPSRARALPDDHLVALQKSPFVYVSPLKKDGSESRCHAEVWYAWIDGAVVMTVAADRWKANAIAAGLDRARIWVGDYGRLKGLNARSQAFREGPTFDARAETNRDLALIDRLLVQYDRKYPDEIGNWRDKMRKGTENGTRITIRYTPIP